MKKNKKKKQKPKIKLLSIKKTKKTNTLLLFEHYFRVALYYVQLS